MKKGNTRFEQVPLEFVKKIAERDFANKKKSEGDNVIYESPGNKKEPYSVPPLSRRKPPRW
jgi:hypothetical protein